MPCPRIANFHHYPIVFSIQPRGDPNGSLGGDGMDGIHQQIDQNLFDLFFIHENIRNAECKMGFDLDVFHITMVAHKTNHVVDDGVDIQAFFLRTGCPGKIEQIFDNGLA